MPKICPNHSFLCLIAKTLQKFGHDTSKDVFFNSLLKNNIPADCKKDDHILCH